MSDNKMHGGLIRKEKRVHTDERGNTTTQHWDGRKDVKVTATPIRVTGGIKNPGGDS